MYVNSSKFIIYFSVFALISFAAHIYSVPAIPYIYVELILLAPFLRYRWANILISISVIISIIRIAQWFYGFEQFFISSYFFIINIIYFPLGIVAALIGLIFLASYAFLNLIKIERSNDFKVNNIVLIMILLLCMLLKYSEDYTKNNLIGTSYGYMLGQFKFAKMFYSDYEIPRLSKEVYPAGRGAEYALKNKTNLVLIVVESLGEPKRIVEMDKLFLNFDSSEIKKKYEIIRGVIEVQGSTIHGEIRELCGGRLPDGIFGDNSDVCIPKKLLLAGYDTTAIHANSSKMYGRNEWYPKMGFVNYINSETPNFPSDSYGNRWGSLLDTSLFEWLYLSQQKSGKTFEYILTVSTHLPAILMPGINADKSCELNSSRNACVHLKNLKSVIDKMAVFVMKRDNTTFVIVGDHPPPFVNLSSKDAFKDNSVPYLILMPKNK